MKLINIEVEKYVVTDDLELRVLFWKWIIARFRVETNLDGITNIIRK